MSTDEVNKLTPDEFFQTIGDKVKNFAPAAEGVEDADDERAVEEIESLCMNCGKNVSRTITTSRIGKSLTKGSRVPPDFFSP